jgi:hypothetical protein
MCADLGFMVAISGIIDSSLRTISMLRLMTLVDDTPTRARAADRMDG